MRLSIGATRQRVGGMRQRFGVVMVLLATLPSCAGALTGLPGADGWHAVLAQCMRLHADHPIAFTLVFASMFALLSALALPGCAALALFAGPAFGVVGGTLLVGASSTLGALGAFLAARHLARASVQARFGHRLVRLERLLAERGPWMLLVLRLVPLVPFPVLNPLLGLTRMPVRNFVAPSLLGLTIGSVPYVGLGGSIERLLTHDVAHAAPIAAAALALLVMPYLLRRRLLRWMSR